MQPGGRDQRCLLVTPDSSEASTIEAHLAQKAPNWGIIRATGLDSERGEPCDLILMAGGSVSASEVERATRVVPETPVVVIAGSSLPQSAVGAALRAGAADVLLLNEITDQSLQRSVDRFHGFRRSFPDFEEFLRLHPFAVLEFDAQRNLLFCNAAARQLVARLQVPGPPQILPEETLAQFQETLRSGTQHRDVRVTVNGCRLSCSAVPLTSARTLFVVVSDVTKSLPDEERHLESHKLEAIGRLAGGIAHDFNNLLTVIGGDAELLVGRLAHDDEGRSLAVEIRTAARRAASLTARLLAFGRKQVLNPVVLDLNAVVRELQGLIARLVGDKIEISARLDPALQRTRADRAQMEQVILDLVANAHDAMRSRGTLSLATKNVRLEVATSAGTPPGKYVLLTVSDNGCGMDAQIRARLFEPFFSTKETGKGTGLGLASVYGVIRQSDGFIEVDSEPGKGATFSIYMPATSEAAAQAPTSSQALPVLSSGDEAVLLVEDDPGVRMLFAKTLHAAGYKVLDASDGEEALEHYQVHAGIIRLVVTDVIMSRMGGVDLAVRLRERSPSLPILFVSGYPEDLDFQKKIGGASDFLAKPVLPRALLVKVRELLAGAHRTST